MSLALAQRRADRLLGTGRRLVPVMMFNNDSNESPSSASISKGVHAVKAASRVRELRKCLLSAGEDVRQQRCTSDVIWRR